MPDLKNPPSQATGEIIDETGNPMDPWTAFFIFCGICFVAFLIYKYQSRTEKVSAELQKKDDIELVKELSQNFNQFKNSFIHLSAAARDCAINPNSNACELLQNAYYDAYRYQREVPNIEVQATATNIKLRDLRIEGRLGAQLFSRLKVKHRDGIGRILSTDRIFDLGKKVFQEKGTSWQIYGGDIKELEWILFTQGYSLQQWEKNEGYKDPSKLRPQFDKVPSDSPVTDLVTGYSAQEKLRWAGFNKIQDILDFIKTHGGNWEVEIQARGLGKPQIENLKDALIDSGYDDVFENLEESTALSEDSAIEELGLTYGVQSTLKDKGINTIKDLLKKIKKYSEWGNWKEQMKKEKLPNIGPGNIDKIEKALQERGYTEWLKKIGG